MSGADIASLPGWRWCPGLATLCGHRVTSVEGGVYVHVRQRAGQAWHEVLLHDPKPDPADPLLPGWLLHLLRERHGAHVLTAPAADGSCWAVWGDGRTLACAGAELDALAAALRGSP